MASTYACGAEFLPSPLASKAEFALTAQLPFIRMGHMTAVAVAVEMDHAVAFLGTATGEVTTPQLTFLWTFNQQYMTFLFMLSFEFVIFCCPVYISHSFLRVSSHLNLGGIYR